MIKIAILEHEQETKEIAFTLAGLFANREWLFRHFYKASKLAKAMKEEQYQIFFLDEIFHTPRLDSVFIHDNPSAMLVYLCKDIPAEQDVNTHGRVYFICKDHLREDLENLADVLIPQALQQDTYSLIYHGAKIELPMEDIYYLEKNGKNVHFHTRKGEFQRRLNLVDLEEEFEQYGFLRTHNTYMVNSKYITAVFKDEVEVHRKYRVPLSRANKKRLQLTIR